MKPFSFLFLPRVLGVAAMMLVAIDLYAQGRGTTTGGRGTTPVRPTTGATGGGFSGGTGSGGQRQYPNSTQVGDATITSDLDTRRLIIVTDDDTNENIKAILAQLDKPKPQVMINVVFVQVSHDKNLDLGAEGVWNGTLAVKTEPKTVTTTRFGVMDQFKDSTQFGVFYQLFGRDVNATIHALSGVAKTEILSRPSILTRSGQQAYIQVGQRVPIIESTRISDISNTAINTVVQQDVGIILRVTPFITQEGMVEMIVSPEISSLSATTVPIGNGATQPVIDTRVAETVVVTPSDQTIVIGGLISTQKDNSEKKVPLLGDIPILGHAFKRTEKKDVKTELLIFLTPHVVQNPTDLANLAKDERQKMDMAPKSFQKEEMERYIGPK
jgi:type II secretory pathway component GspD/PulD (secretin)